jgi:ribose 5-phosphate isomerase
MPISRRHVRSAGLSRGGALTLNVRDIALTTLDDIPELDLTVDGADEIAPDH